MKTVGLFFTLLLVCSLLNQCKGLGLKQSLPLPVSGGLQAGDIDSLSNKGYSVISTSSGSMLIRFNLNPLEFSSTDFVFTPVLVSRSNGALVDSINEKLYLYGYNSGIGEFASVAAIQSFNISNGTSLKALSTYYTLGFGSDGFNSAILRPNTDHIYVINQDTDNSVMFELNLAGSVAELVHVNDLMSPVAGTNFTYSHGALWQTSGSLENQLATQTYFVFGSIGSEVSASESFFGPPTFTSYYSTYPWLADKSSTMTGNYSLSGLASCKDQTLVVNLVASCSATANTCSSFSIIPLSSTLEPQTKISLGSFDVNYNTTTTITCVPNQESVLVTIGNTLLKVDLATQQVEKYTSPKTEDFIWCSVDHTGTYAYIGALAYSAGATSSTSVLQIVL